MAEQKPLYLNAQGMPEELASADTIPLSNLPSLSETIQDAVGAMVPDTDTVDATYNDGAGTLSLAVKSQMSITSDPSGLKLSGDAESPGNNQYYGTNGAGAKGYFALPTASAAEIRTMTAGETTGASKLVYVSASNTIMLAVANNAAKIAVGFVINSIANAATGSVYLGPGIITGLSGGTPGAKGWLSASTPGGIVSSPPGGPGEITQPVGFYLTATEFFFNPSMMYGVRASA